MTVTSDNKHKSLHQMINHQFVQSPVKCTKAEFIERLACLPSHIYRLKGFMTFKTPHIHISFNLHKDNMN